MDLYNMYKGFVDWVLEKFNFFPISTIFSHFSLGNRSVACNWVPLTHA